MAELGTLPRKPEIGWLALLALSVGAAGLGLRLYPNSPMLQVVGTSLLYAVPAVLIYMVAAHLVGRVKWERAAVAARVASLERDNTSLQQAVIETEQSLGEATAGLASLQSELAEARMQLSWKDAERVAAGIERAKSMWLARASLDTTAAGYEDDPVYGQLSVDSGLGKVLSQPIVQRLNHIRHLSFAYLTFHSATHTRLAHSLGACRNAEAVMTKIFRQGEVYPRGREGPEKITLTDGEKLKLIRLARVAALLHDLGHGPLSHALDIHIGLALEQPTITPDVEFSRRYIDRHLRDVIYGAGVDPEDVISLLQDDKQRLQGWYSFIGDLVSSPLDVDRMDYLARDAHMTGLSVGALNMDAFVERIVPFKEVEHGVERIELAFHESAIPYIEQFLYARDIMYIDCYEHQRKVVAEGMLGKAFEEFRAPGPAGKAIPVEDLAILSDQQITELMLATCGPGTLAYRMVDLLMKGLTFRLVLELPMEIDLHPIQRVDPSALEKVGPEVHASVMATLTADGEIDQTGWAKLPLTIRHRARGAVRTDYRIDPAALSRLPLEFRHWAKAARTGEYGEAYIRIPDQWARRIAERSDLAQEGQVLVTVPSWSIVRNWLKEGEIRILTRQGSDGYTVEYCKDVSSVLSSLVRTLARARLKIRVFVAPDVTLEQEKKAAEEALKFFAGDGGEPPLTPQPAGRPQSH
jgi:HD superfamily phosphohydrolase